MSKDLRVLEATSVELLTPKEAADFLRVSLQSVYQRVSRGQLKCIHMGRLVRFKRSALEEFISECEAR